VIETAICCRLISDAYSSCAMQTIPPSCERRTPAGDSTFTTLVLTFLFAAICINLCNLFFSRLSERYLSVSKRYSGLSLPGLCLLRTTVSTSSSENSTRLFFSEELRRFSKTSIRFSVSSAAVRLIIWRNVELLVSLATCDSLLADPVIWENAALFGPWTSHL